MIVLHVRHAFLYISLAYSSKPLHEMTKLKVFATTWTNYSESFGLTLSFKSVRTNPVTGHLAHSILYKQDGIIMKYLESLKLIFLSDVLVAVAVAAGGFPIDE